MSAFAQDGTGDWLLTTKGGGKKLTLVTDVSQLAAQKLTNRFTLWLGEWFLNPAIGLPFFTLIAVKNPDLGVLKQLFSRIVLDIPGITKLDFLNLNLTNTRQLVMNMQAKTDSAFIVTGGEGSPFIVKNF